MTATDLPTISTRILSVRGQRVILDADLAALYEVPTKRFNEAVKRNLPKFPSDFMFQLEAEEWAGLRSQIATSSWAGHGGRRHVPRVFTEHGALMAATLLSSPRAIEVSVYVVRAFVRLREVAGQHGELARRLDELENRTAGLGREHELTRTQLKQVFDALRSLMTPPDPPRRPIGFIHPRDEKPR